MKVLREKEYPDGKFTLCFIGYGDESTNSRHRAHVQLGHAVDYALGDGFGHIALGTDDIKGACDKVRALGYKVDARAGPMKHGTTVIAFVEDPTGYKIELIERA